MLLRPSLLPLQGPDEFHTGDDSYAPRTRTAVNRMFPTRTLLQRAVHVPFQIAHTAARTPLRLQLTVWHGTARLLPTPPCAPLARCYVNAAAALSLRYAANFSAAHGLPHPANWTAIAEGVRMPFDAKRQLHLEFAQWNDQMKCKQADTIMLSYPFGVDMPAAVRQNDLDYYAAHTGNGPVCERR